MAKIVQSDQFSPKGNVFKTWWECDECHKVVDPHHNFCPWCGEKFQRG